ncbi:MAG: MgtC/SapB family protein [Acidobacteriaceae bacterium]|nr:MgtC/SapB family protein [Acidobacteriaceae bacterium]MBV8571195.1 MgtC/SapB family protein [Acidobacteriaceae bacterium]
MVSLSVMGRELLQVSVAYLLTIPIGWNREREERSTGIRAFPIVGMAACGYILILGPNADISARSRVLQGVITGIGFVGAGAILKEGITVRGPATAASVWNAGAIGAAVGLQQYEIAIILSMLNVLTLQLLLPLKNWIDRRSNGRG